MKKKGFTLVELLAVIVVLAILAIVAVPIVVNTLENSRKDSFKNSARGILEAADMYYTKYAGQEITLDLTDENQMKDLDFNGRMPDSGYVYITKSGDMAIEIYNNKYCAYKYYSSNDIVVESQPCESLNLESKEIESNYYINLQDGYNTKIKNLKIYGNTINSKKLGSTGTISLVITGKNLFNGEKYLSGSGKTINGINMKYNATDDTIELNGTDTNEVANSADTYFQTNLKINSNISMSTNIYVSGSVTGTIPGTTAPRTNICPGYWPYNKTGSNIQYINIGTKVSGTNIYKQSTGALNADAEPTFIKFYLNATSGGTFKNYKFRIQTEYGTNYTEYEKHKEKIYNIELKTLTGNIISGIGTDEILEKKDNVWGITLGSTFTQLHNDTQKVLNSITLYDGVNNIYIDEVINPTKLSLNYYK